jgi:hypothetical protein
MICPFLRVLLLCNTLGRGLHGYENLVVYDLVVVLALLMVEPFYWRTAHGDVLVVNIAHVNNTIPLVDAPGLHSLSLSSLLKELGVPLVLGSVCALK